MRNNTTERLIPVATSAAFALIAALIASDLLIDGREGVSVSHLVLEGLVFLMALAGAVLTLRRFLRIRRDLDLARQDTNRWRDQHRALVQGLGAAISEQFDAWRLTPSEAEIGMLLLKGLSHAQIAEIRGTSERTVREQSRALYRKAGLEGRADLAAFFLEDLLPPQQQEGQPG
jgi:DNA-binding CsgD family transcriptional regulator